MFKDLRFSFRMLLKRPAFTAAAVATLALGITANTTVFTFVNAFLLKPFPFPNDHELVAFGRSNLGGEAELGSLSFPDFEDIRVQSTAFSHVAAYSWANFNLSAQQRPLWAGGSRVSADFFQTLGVSPLIGRAFSQADNQPGAPPVVILSESLWNNHFGRSQGIVDSQIRVDGILRTVIGIIPTGQELPIDARAWIPLALQHDETDRNKSWLSGIGRLAPNQKLTQARAEMMSLGQSSQSIQADSSSSFAQRGFHVITLKEDQLGQNARMMFFLLLGSVVLLLLIVCTNVANLQLSRAVARHGEFAIRTAIGATRGRLIRQMLMESFILASLAALIGLLLSRVAIRFGISRFPSEAVDWFSFGMDYRVLGYTAGIAILATLFFGLIPALRVSRMPRQSSLGSLGSRTSAGRSSQRMQSILVISEMAMALGLLAGGSVMVRGLVRLANENPGFESKNVVIGSLSLSEEQYPTAADRARFGNTLREKLGTSPGISSVGFVSSFPLSGSSLYRTYSVEGQSDQSYRENPDAIFKAASPDYFTTMNIPLIAGRPFSFLDRAGAPGVAILNEPLAAGLWPGDSPLGKRIKFDLPSVDAPWIEVVGVVAGTKHEKINRAAPPQIYMAYAQSPSKRLTFAAKTSIPAAGLMKSIESHLHEIAPHQALFSVMDLEAHLNESFWSIQMTTQLLWIFGAIALGLAAIGIYGVMSFAVQERRQELGIRMALGAVPREILALIVRRGLRLGLFGLAAGTALGLGMTKAIGSAVLRSSQMDLLSLFYAMTLLLVTCLLACVLPGLRAAGQNPAAVLRRL